MRSIRNRITAWTTRAALATVVVASFASGAFAQGSGIQQTPDSARYLISKDVGNERWAITYNLDDRTVTGTDPVNFPGESIGYRFRNDVFMPRLGLSVKF